MNLKKPLTFEEQIDKLIAHGIVISNRKEAENILKKVNYYRFTGYALQFRKNLLIAITKKEPHLKQFIICMKWMKCYAIYFDNISKNQKYIIEHK